MRPLPLTFPFQMMPFKSQCNMLFIAFIDGSLHISLYICYFNSNIFSKLSGATFSCALFVNKRVRCWGATPYGALGTDSGSDVTEVSTLGYIPFSDTSEVLSLSQGGNGQHHVIIFFLVLEFILIALVFLLFFVLLSIE